MAVLTSTPALTLKNGSTGRIVRKLQECLGVAADGKCGPKTLAAAGARLGGFAPSLRTTISLDELRLLGVDVRLVVDLSGHNEGGAKRPVDFAKLAHAGVSGVWLKLTEGVSYVNTEARRQVDAARKAGFLVGGYHFGDPSVDRRGLTIDAIAADAHAEAEHYLDTRRLFFGGTPPTLPDVLDVERVMGQRIAGKLAALLASPRRAESTVQWCLTWLDAVGGSPWVYTADWAFRGYLKGAPGPLLAELAKRPLWVASYNSGVEPARMPALWSEWSAWQFTGSGAIDGVDGKVDLNWALAEDLLA